MPHRATVPAALLLAAICTPAMAEPDVSLADRALVLDIELHRKPVKELLPLLARDRSALTRSLAIRALGRIGDRPDVVAALGALLQDETEPQRALAVWAAGIARAKDLYAPLVKLTGSARTPLAAAAAAALGWCPDERVADTLAGLLGHRNPAIREGALVGLGRARAHAHLEAAVLHLDAKEPEVRAAADYACWLMAHGRQAARTEAAKAKSGKTVGTKAWDGDASLAAAFLSRLTEQEPETRMAGLRPMGVLLPGTIARKDWPKVFALLADPDPRVVQGLVWRVLSTRKGPDVDAALATALGHGDPKVRQLAAEALGQRKLRKPLLAAFARERDVRLRFVLAVEIARTGDLSAWRVAEHLAWRPDDTVKEHAEVLCKALAGSARSAAFAADAGHPIAFAALCEHLGDKERKKDAEEALDYLGVLRSDPNEIVAVAGLVAAHRLSRYYGDLLFLAEDDATTDVRLAMLDAFAELTGDGGDKELGNETRKRMTAWLASTAKSDQSAFVRDKARQLLKKGRDLGNDYRGLPRPDEPLFGVETPGEGDWLDARDVARLAHYIRTQAPKVRFETTAGSFTVAVDAHAAPAHAVSLFLAVHASVYDGTRFHRVVPNFVIQGGDPSGTGAGHAGWTVPDEISPLPYVRGALGMPKSRKDDGGCQIFVMHTPYRPLDERYTCYGNVVQGLETVDRIRVGDVIRRAVIVK